MSNYISKHNFPDDLKTMSFDDLELLSYELRDFLISSVSKTGGHLAPNLGVVELTIALHRCFDTPKDKLIWDVGHQTYIHKVLTGRADNFNTLRQFGGMSGFPKVCESEYDTFDTGHSSTSISLGLGMAAARELKKEDYNVVSVIGDGALTGGTAFEALNNAGNSKYNFIVILNDNGMSISPNTGGLSKSLGRITSTDKYMHLKTQIKKGVSKVPVIGEGMVSGIHHAKENIKYAVIDGIFFEELGFKYIGPVNGHNIKELCDTMELAKGINGPVLIHCVTKKGKGYSIAEEKANIFHGIGPFDIDTGKPVKNSSTPSYSSIFGTEITNIADRNDSVVAVSAAMIDGVGLNDFSVKHHERMYDVGIAEGHAVTFSAGLAKAGLKPFVAIYSTFLQRAYDHILEDICLQKLPVVLCIDRAGIVGADGETHQGLYDIAYLRTMPGLNVMAPKDDDELRAMMNFAADSDEPCSIRYPRGASVHIDINEAAPIVKGKSEVITEGKDVDIWAVGNMVSVALKASELLKSEGIEAGVTNMRFIKPLDTEAVMRSAESHKLIVTLEDGVTEGGIGETVSTMLNTAETNVLCLGWPDKFIEHGKPDELYEKYGLNAEKIAEKIKSEVNR